MSEKINTKASGKYYVLFVDDEEKTRKAFSRLFGNEFKILLAADGAEGFEVFQERGDEIGVIITDQKMPRETGVQFLAKVSAIHDDVVRILSTAYADLEYTFRDCLECEHLEGKSFHSATIKIGLSF